MMNTLDLLENDYKLLQGEMKKKHTNIKEVRDKYTFILISQLTER